MSSNELARAASTKKRLNPTAQHPPRIVAVVGRQCAPSGSFAECGELRSRIREHRRGEESGELHRMRLGISFLNNRSAADSLATLFRRLMILRACIVGRRAGILCLAILTATVRDRGLTFAATAATRACQRAAKNGHGEYQRKEVSEHACEIR
jgi:hypothetical protein